MRRPRSPWRALAMGALLVGLAAVPPAAVRAATVTVSTCDEPTLRSVISAAGPGDTVSFSCNGTIVLTSGGGGPIVLSSNLTFDGSGQTVTISGGGSVRVFVVDTGVTVTLTDLTIANGSAGHSQPFSTNVGGGISNQGTLSVTNSTFSGNSAERGGGISNQGTLSVTNSTFSGNSAICGGGCGIGGGIFDDEGGTLSVTNSTFSGNSAGYGGGGIFNLGPVSVTNSTFSGNSASYGGGIWNQFTMTATNSTFSGNSAGRGGGVFNVGTLSVTNSTFSGNRAGPGGIWNQGGANLANTILAGSTGGNCQAYSWTPFTDQGGNLADDGTCSFSQSSSVNNAASLKLGPLASNGGPTQTIALGSGSVAIDFTSCLQSADQRGFDRPDAGEARCDSGAYEVQDPLTSIAVSPATPTIPNGTDQQFIATGTYSNGWITDISALVTWASNDTSVATIGAASGLAHGLIPGTTSISATLGSVSGTTLLSVTPATLTITASSGTMTYGGTVPTITPSYSGFVNGDDASSLTTQPTCITAATSSSPVASYSSSCSGAVDPNYTIGYVKGTVSVTPASTTTTLTSSANPSLLKQPVTFTATVTSPGGTPGGTVQFTIDGSNFGSPVTLSGGKATSSSTSSLAVGSHAITAVYGGALNFSGSTGTLTQTVSYRINVLYDQTKSNKSGSSVPIKVQLLDYTGTNLSSSTITLTLSAPAVTPSPSPGAQPTGTFTLMSGPMYQYNVKTTSYKKGTYTLSFRVTGDPVIHTVQFVIG